MSNNILADLYTSGVVISNTVWDLIGARLGSSKTIFDNIEHLIVTEPNQINCPVGILKDCGLDRYVEAFTKNSNNRLQEPLPIARVINAGMGLAKLNAYMLNREDTMASAVLSVGLGDAVADYVMKTQLTNFPAQLIYFNVLVARCAVVATVEAALTHASTAIETVKMPRKDAGVPEWNDFWTGINNSGRSPRNTYALGNVLSSVNPAWTLVHHFGVVKVQVAGFICEEDFRGGAVETNAGPVGDMPPSGRGVLDMVLDGALVGISENAVRITLRDLGVGSLIDWLANSSNARAFFNLGIGPSLSDLVKRLEDENNMEFDSANDLIDDGVAKFNVLTIYCEHGMKCETLESCDGRKIRATLWPIYGVSHNNHDVYTVGKPYITTNESEIKQLTIRAKNTALSKYGVLQGQIKIVTGTFMYGMNNLDIVQPNATYAHGQDLLHSFKLHIAGPAHLRGGCWRKSLRGANSATQRNNDFVLAPLETLLIGVAVNGCGALSVLVTAINQFVYKAPEIVEPGEMEDFFRTQHVFQNPGQYGRRKADSEKTCMAYLFGYPSHMAYFRRKHITGM